MNLFNLRQMIGINIRNARLRKGYTQRFLADRIRISATYCSNIENGQLNPTLEHLYRIASELDVEVIDLLSEAREEDAGETKGDELSRSSEASQQEAELLLKILRLIYQREMKAIIHEMPPEMRKKISGEGCASIEELTAVLRYLEEEQHETDRFTAELKANVRFDVISKILLSEGRYYTVYGLRVRMPGKELLYPDIDTSREKITSLAWQCNFLGVSPVHIEDIIEDYLTG